MGRKEIKIVVITEEDLRDLSDHFTRCNLEDNYDWLKRIGYWKERLR